MGALVTNLLGGNLLQGLSQVINSIKGKNPGDALQLQELADKYQTDIMLADLQRQQMQADVNKAEATNNNMFVAGWRPFCGWVAGTGLLAQFLVGPMATWVASLMGKPVAFPQLDMGTLMTLLLGMLGLGGMRTYEKVNGVGTSNH